MKWAAVLTMGIVVVLGASAFAGTTETTTKTETATKTGNAVKPVKVAQIPTADKTAKVTTTNPAKMTCGDFVMLEDVVTPRVIYWAEGYSLKGRPESATFDVATMDRLVPVLIAMCKNEPKESFVKKAKAEFKKVL